MENKELIEEMRKAEIHISEIVSYFEDNCSKPPCQTYVDASNEADEAIKKHR